MSKNVVVRLKILNSIGLEIRLVSWYEISSLTINN